MRSIGKVAVLSVLDEPVAAGPFRIITGQVGSMGIEKVVAAVETAAKREGLIADDHYRGEHALYHAVLEALHGVCRGQLELGSILRTAGLKFAVVAGPKAEDQTAEGRWLAVALYGHIGAPRKGFEHEVIGLGINHL
ncbi:HutP family protein [Desulfotomaculum copahuensis]|uniref:Hut operon positive regulatory protein n=1 Tax=Desulfotomaculum copahuensis TaxID=1838280 RepID=A0A1B7LDU6_9FIRM|nr:HutP family protein [Desulfotomaculum copahuensis]OAT81249.1 anti-terminator HutP [Desulfotomaculum copahuensis]